MKTTESCITPDSTFQYGVHKPGYSVANLRSHAEIRILGRLVSPEQNGREELIDNKRNYPVGDVDVLNADWIFEIPNAFSFRGRTYIDKEWADFSADHPERICLKKPPSLSFTAILEQEGINSSLFDKLPQPVHLALATCSTDAADLIRLAHLSCKILMSGGRPDGLAYTSDSDRGRRPVIYNHELFEAVANNPHLPDDYKIIMVIRPGAQGGSEIVGDFLEPQETHVFEYLRRNSYIPGGHYAANMADDAVRYSIEELKPSDIKGLRHLYYQRSFVRLAQELEIPVTHEAKRLSAEELEQLRKEIISAIDADEYSPATLWGWNFGFDFAPSLYRLHASHQQIHQQYAMISDTVERYVTGCSSPSGQLCPYSLGDLVSECVKKYTDSHGSSFFNDYLKALRANSRMDDRTDLQSSLIVWEDERVILFVPKAQTSQWELQLMTLPDQSGRFPGNVFECDIASRSSLDTGILKAQKVLSGLGAKMVTSIEYSKRVSSSPTLDQALLYAFMPRLPESPGAFSEAQLRYINGHYPEDFAAACRSQL